MESHIYRTHETWGSVTYFFTEDKYDEFMDGMRRSFDGEEIEEPDLFSFDDETKLYCGKYYRNFGRERVRVVDWSDPSDLQIEYVEGVKT